jgi:hypothetical protein
LAGRRGRSRILHRYRPGAFSHAHISFEGYLSDCGAQIAGAATAETELQAQDYLPTLDFVVLPLEPDTIKAILDHVLPDTCLLTGIVHIEIEKDQQIEFGAYDNFDTVFCGPAVPRDLLDGMLVAGVLRSIKPSE